MRTRIIGALVLTMTLFSPAAWAQTSTQIEAKYGAPVKSYSVSEDIWMSPEFADDGQLCMARLYPKKIDATTNYLNSMLQLWEVKDVFDELAPTSARGKKKEDYGLLIIGNTVFAGFGYENVRINFVSPLRSSSPAATAVNKGQAGEEAEFPGVWSAQVVTITWLNRQCATPQARYNNGMQRTRNSAPLSSSRARARR